MQDLPDLWGKIISVQELDTVTFGEDNKKIGEINPFRYRGYYYDMETGFYYLNSRYYDPQVKRFINADGQINTDSLFGSNLFAYCENDPVNRFDPYGQDWAWVGNITGSVYGKLTSQSRWMMEIYEGGIQNCSYRPISPTYSEVFSSSDHNANRRPNRGEPNSTFHAPNGDTRTFGPDRKHHRDYDHDDHGHPETHPHDENGDHYHDWDWSNPEKPRQGPYVPNFRKYILGGALILGCVVGIIVLVADDVSIAGACNDWLLIPLSSGIEKGMVMIFG